MSDVNSKNHLGVDDAADTGPIGTQNSGKPERGHRPYLPHTIRIFAVPISGLWA